MAAKDAGAGHIRDYYTLLDAPILAGVDELGKAFRRQAMLFHPDRAPIGTDVAIFHRIAEAYEILSDADLKSQFDCQRAQLHKEGRLCLCRPEYDPVTDGHLTFCPCWLPEGCVTFKKKENVSATRRVSEKLKARRSTSGVSEGAIDNYTSSMMRSKTGRLSSSLNALQMLENGEDSPVPGKPASSFQVFMDRLVADGLSQDQIQRRIRQRWLAAGWEENLARQMSQSGSSREFQDIAKQSLKRPSESPAMVHQKQLMALSRRLFGGAEGEC